MYMRGGAPNQTETENERQEDGGDPAHGGVDLMKSSAS
jgi:hypothetical protein